MVCCGLPNDARGVEHHAPSIRLGDLGSSIALSLESHRHLRISIIDSIAGELPAVLLVSSVVIRLSAMSHIVHLHILRRRHDEFFQFPCFLLAEPSFRIPRLLNILTTIDNNRLIDPDIRRNLFGREHFLAGSWKLTVREPG
jgi:hypothetical protein